MPSEARRLTPHEIPERWLPVSPVCPMEVGPDASNLHRIPPKICLPQLPCPRDVTSFRPQRDFLD